MRTPIRNHWIWIGVTILLSSCQWLNSGARPQLPRFESQVPVPVAIQVIDERPGVERGTERSSRWIYSTFDPESHRLQVAGYLGNALSAMGACPSYAVVEPDVPPDAVSHLIQIRMIHAYSRWPVNPNQNRDQIPVQGSVEFRVSLYLNGALIDTTTIDYQQQDFLVPVRIIKPGMARKVVGDALIHQYEQTVKDSLEELLHRLESPWPTFSGEVSSQNESRRRLTPNRRM